MRLTMKRHHIKESKNEEDRKRKKEIPEARAGDAYNRAPHPLGGTKPLDSGTAQTVDGVSCALRGEYRDDHERLAVPDVEAWRFYHFPQTRRPQDSHHL